MDRLTAMEVFVRIVQTGSFSAVGRDLGMTQPTVSKQLTALERNSNPAAQSQHAPALAHRSWFRVLRELQNASSMRCGRLMAIWASCRRSSPAWLRINTSIGLGQVYLGPMVLKVSGAASRTLDRSVVLGPLCIRPGREGIDVAIRIGRLNDSKPGRAAHRQFGTQRNRHAGHTWRSTANRRCRRICPSGHNCLLYAYLSTGKRVDVPGPEGEIRVKVSGNFRSNNGEAIRQWVFGDLASPSRRTG